MPGPFDIKLRGLTLQEYSTYLAAPHLAAALTAMLQSFDAPEYQDQFKIGSPEDAAITQAHRAMELIRGIPA